MTTIKTDDIPIAFKSFCIKTNGETSLCPENFEQMEIEWYINHSTEPNTAKLHDSDTSNQLEKINARTICAIKDIKAGDEILINYNYL